MLLRCISGLHEIEQASASFALPQLIMDVSGRQKLRLHAPKLLLWAIFEGFVIATTVMRVRRMGAEVHPNDEEMRRSDIDCSMTASRRRATGARALRSC